jgi:hypothetical protein
MASELASASPPRARSAVFKYRLIFISSRLVRVVFLCSGQSGTLLHPARSQTIGLLPMHSHPRAIAGLISVNHTLFCQPLHVVKNDYTAQNGIFSNRTSQGTGQPPQKHFLISRNA